MFRQQNKESPNFSIKINNIPIKNTNLNKYLGLVVDDKLNWENHLVYLQQKIIPLMGALHRCAEYLNEKNKYLIYNSYVLSHLRYLINIWGNTGIVNLKKIQLLQNKTIKILFKKHFSFPKYSTE